MPRQIRNVDGVALDMPLRLGTRLDHRRARPILVIPDESQPSRLAAIVGLGQAVAIHPSLAPALNGAAGTSGRTAPH
jgi:hypothetical protein